jgi:hypothetical protein
MKFKSLNLGILRAHKSKGRELVCARGLEVELTIQKKAAGPVQDTHGSMLQFRRGESHTVHTLNAPVIAAVIIRAIKQGLHISLLWLMVLLT